MFKSTKVEIGYESEDVIEERAKQEVGNVFAWVSGESVGRKIELLSGKVYANCRTCGVRFEIERPWSINPEGHVIVPRVFATVSEGKRSFREEVEVFLCREHIEEHLEKIATPRMVPKAPEILPVFRAPTNHGFVYSSGKTAADAARALPRDKLSIISAGDFAKRATVYVREFAVSKEVSR